MPMQIVWGESGDWREPSHLSSEEITSDQRMILQGWSRYDTEIVR
jgi:hypothetical protein